MASGSGSTLAESDAQIGSHALIGSHARIGSDARIESGALIESGAHYIRAGRRLDGYAFDAWCADGVITITAGCRTFSLDEARAHWGSPTYRDRALGEESLLFVEMTERLLRLRGLVLKRNEGDAA